MAIAAVAPKAADLFEDDFSDLPLYAPAKAARPLRPVSTTISIGDAVRYEITNHDASKREEYIMILDQPSNWKLGIVSSEEAIAKVLLGRKQGDRFQVDIDGRIVEIVITMKHELAV